MLERQTGCPDYPEPCDNVMLSSLSLAMAYVPMQVWEKPYDADILANNFKNIYPNPNMVDTRTTTSLSEVLRTRAPAVLIEVAYHDNPEDAAWIKENIDARSEERRVGEECRSRWAPDH